MNSLGSESLNMNDLMTNGNFSVVGERQEVFYDTTTSDTECLFVRKNNPTMDDTSHTKFMKILTYPFQRSLGVPYIIQTGWN